MEFYEKHKADRDYFEIIAFHEPSAKNFAQLDKFMAKLEKDKWGGKKLPFPIAIDSTGGTVKRWRVPGYPTIVLIDPDGNVAKYQVGHSDELSKFLETKLEEAKKAGPPKKTGADKPAKPESKEDEPDDVEVSP